MEPKDNSKHTEKQMQFAVNYGQTGKLPAAILPTASDAAILPAVILPTANIRPMVKVRDGQVLGFSQIERLAIYEQVLAYYMAYVKNIPITNARGLCYCFCKVIEEQYPSLNTEGALSVIDVVYINLVAVFPELAQYKPVSVSAYWWPLENVEARINALQSIITNLKTKS